MSEAFAAGEVCLLVDGRGRRHLLDLSEGASFHSHAGVVGHDDIIGSQPGVVLRSSTGAKVIALRPRLADYVLTMRRGAQVVYPKDLGPILHWADVRSGHVVVEAGTGSGALTLALLEAVGPAGRVVSLERRLDHLEHARSVITRFLGSMPPNLDLIRGDVADEISGHHPHRVVLDVPEPWHVVGPSAEAMRPDGILAAYLPTVPQVQRLREELQRSRRYLATETFEVLHREWRIDGRSVRPASQMVGHTGFITIARLLSPSPA